MFNLINKKNAWKKILLSLILGGTLFAIPQSSFASLSEDYPKYWMKVGTNSVANMLSNWTKAITSYEKSKYDIAWNKFTVDIFWDNASKYRVKDQEVSLYWLEAVKWVMKSKYPNCKIKENQILAILFDALGTWIYLRDEIMTTVPEWQWPKNADKASWILELTTCMMGENKKLSNAQVESEVISIYREWVERKKRSLLLEETNLWVEKYYNWTLDDSTYDIFYDMGQIAKIFYEDIAPVTKTSVIFYKMPHFGNNNNGNWGWWEWGQQTSSDPNNPSNPSNQNSPNNPSNPNSPSNPSNPNNPQNQDWGKQWWESLPSITDDEEINNIINNGTEEHRTVTNNWNTAYVNKCVVSWSPKLEEAYLKAEEEVDDLEEIQSPFDVSEEYLDDLIDDIIKNSDELKRNENNPLTGENKKESDDVPWSKGAVDDAAAIDDLRKQLQSCVDKCDWLRIDERAICKAKCLCAEYSSKALPENTEMKFLQEWALRIRICNIPSKPVVVSTSSKSVISRESILVEIHDTIKAMFESWELTPKMKKQEWLDTSMNNIKFSDVVSFNIWMMFKKPVTKRATKKEDLEELNKNLETQILNITQNSFNVMLDAEAADHAATTMSKTIQAPKVAEISESTDTLIHETRIAWVLNTFDEFIKKHDNLIVELTTVVDEMSKAIEWRLNNAK